jgi:hypothetical protein
VAQAIKRERRQAWKDSDHPGEWSLLVSPSEICGLFGPRRAGPWLEQQRFELFRLMLVGLSLTKRL